MEAFTTLTGVVMPLNRTNVNTDEITPARFLKTIKRNGFSHARLGGARLARSLLPAPSGVPDGSHGSQSG